MAYSNAYRIVTLEEQGFYILFSQENTLQDMMLTLALQLGSTILGLHYFKGYIANINNQGTNLAGRLNFSNVMLYKRQLLANPNTWKSSMVMLPNAFTKTCFKSKVKL